MKTMKKEKRILFQPFQILKDENSMNNNWTKDSNLISSNQIEKLSKFV